VVTDEIASADPVRRCLNCGTPAPGNFCPHCGQATATQALSLADAAGEWLTGPLARDGRLRQTLVRLFFAPGALTADWLAGRRARYLRPLQLYLVTSVVVFAAVQFLGLNLSLRLYADRGVHIVRSTRLPLNVEPDGRLRLAPVQIVLDHVDTPAVRRFLAMPIEDRFALLRARRAAYVSPFVLFLVPALAATLGLFYRDRRRRYAEHLVFGLHCQTFFLIALLLEAKLPAVIANALSLWVIAYFMIALRRVYDGTWVETLARGSIVLALYFAIFFTANLLLVLALLGL
jgi:hypothetical protein